jgi:hypothetical protein
MQMVVADSPYRTHGPSVKQYGEGNFRRTHEPCAHGGRETVHIGLADRQYREHGNFRRTHEPGRPSVVASQTVPGKLQNQEPTSQLCTSN